MPVFDFRCNKCKNVEELLIPLAEVDNPQPCKKCKGDTTKLIPSSITICQQGYSYNTSERDITKKFS